MLNDPLRFWAIISQAVGFSLIILLETLLGRAQAGYWQVRILAVMLGVALLVALLRRYRQRKLLKQAEQRRQLLNDEADDD